MRSHLKATTAHDYSALMWYQSPKITNQDPRSGESNPITMLPVPCTNTLDNHLAITDPKWYREVTIWTESSSKETLEGHHDP
ncbi:hypothetical protein RhiirC2_797442 [Rhizophagus irregularis]|uniref:Uncharacterized protein n=1 Tax=Rhizophagus irregularis TaxID=588596 RepID=A0A2N1M805_9GLOM|nr:hypothetical protein RhiirC2_797442 [Rhizophagus irregularis]